MAPAQSLMIGPRAAWRSGPAGPLLLVLLLMLVLSGFLAYQAWAAARSHRQVTEAALRDYAGFAAWELHRRVESRASAVLNAALAPARGALVLRRGPADPSPEAAMEAFVFAVEGALRACDCADAASDFFSVDLESMAVDVRGATLGPEFREWLTGPFLEQARTPVEPEPSEMAIRTEGRSGGLVIVQRVLSPETVLAVEPPVPLDSSRMVVYAGAQRSEGRRIYGFVVDVPAFVRPLVEAAFGGPSLLPPSLTGAARNMDLLTVDAWTAQGETVFRAGGSASVRGAEVVDTIPLATGHLVARVAVRPEIAGRLVIGGLPRSRVPVLLGSVGLTLVLLLIAVAQLRRQQELFRLRAGFVSGVSHELRTPLAQIRLFSDLLASGRLDDGQRRRATRILTDEAKRLTYLVDNVLRFSRSERRMERITPTVQEVAPLLREIVDDFAPLARSREAQVVVEAPDHLRAPLDADALRQVLLNLLDNAVKYGPRGQRIDVRALRGGEWLQLEVDDEGPGIPAADREWVWEAYRRLTRDVEAATGGSGIGLAVVRELVELHGGRAFVTDSPRGGSRFVIRLPGAELPEAAPVQPAAVVACSEAQA